MLFASHGIETPDAYWKTIIRNDRVIAWIIDNDRNATRANLDSYLVSVRELEALTGETIPVADYLKDDIPPTSWVRPVGCETD